MKSFIFSVCMTLFFFQVIAQNQTKIFINKDFQEIDLHDFSYYLQDSTGALNIKDITTRYAEKFSKWVGDEISFGGTNDAYWVKVNLVNIAKQPKKLKLLTKGIDSLNIYLLKDNKPVFATITGGHFPFENREYPGNLLVKSFEISPQSNYTLYVRLRNVDYRLGLYPFKMFTPSVADRYIRGNELFQSFYIGGMFLMLLFGVSLTLIFRQKLYFFYSLCIVVSLGMMLNFNDYYYLIFDRAPLFIRNKNVYGFLATMIPNVYLIFTKEFLEFGFDRFNRNNLYDKLTWWVFGIGTFISVLVLVLGISFFHYRYIFFVTNGIINLLNTYFLVRSLQSKYPPAWIYLVANLPVLVIIFWESLNTVFKTPVQKTFTYYYYGTLWEMYFLTMGLVWKFRIFQEERRKLQLEVMGTEEKERKKIAMDLHDKVVGQLSALKLNFDSLVEKESIKDKRRIDKIYETLETATIQTREYSHTLMDNSLEEKGVVQRLESLYQHFENPTFTIQSSGLENKLSQHVETVIFSISQECITNAIKHAEANRIDIQMSRLDDVLTVIVEDNGKGFDLEKVYHEGKGLRNVSYRVKDNLKGELFIDSKIDRGTIIIIKVPLGKKNRFFFLKRLSAKYKKIANIVIGLFFTPSL